MGKRANIARSVMGLACPAALLLAACDSIPADVEQTSERVRAQEAFRVGLVAGSPDEGRIEDLLAGVSTAAAARPEIEIGASEPLLKKLERGALDLVVGPMTAKSPWSTRVHVMPLDSADPLPPDELQLVAMARNGENEWIALVHHQASTVAER